MKQMFSFLLATGLAVAGVQAGNGPLTHQEKTEEGKAAKNQAPSPPSAKSPTPAPGTQSEAAYRIGPQDMLQIDVWKEPEITRLVPVRPDGKISLPLLNDVQAAGLTPMELANVISEGLKKYINNPQVTVSVSTINSRRAYVTGEVTKPGAFALLPNMTVLQALTSAGGFTQFAKIKGIYVLRTDGSKQTKIPFNYKAVVEGKKPEENIALQPGDTVVVP
jgi:polysaccharide export outer membrane protein